MELSTANNIKHGAYRTAEYKVWLAMRDRCRNPKNGRYHQYGGRGINVCARWDDFANFLTDLGPRPSPQHSLDRIDNDRGYNKRNCRWATRHEQMTNRTVTLFVGEVPLATLAKQHGIRQNVLRWRLLKGWSLQDALTRVVRPKRPKMEPVLPDRL